jgi:hypothetical protein
MAATLLCAEPLPDLLEVCSNICSVASRLCYGCAFFLQVYDKWPDDSDSLAVAGSIPLQQVSSVLLCL